MCRGQFSAIASGGAAESIRWWPVGCESWLLAEIESCYDVNERAILNVHLVGLVLTGNFLVWKQDPGAGYRFWPKAGVPEAGLRNRACRCQPTQTLLKGEWVQGLEEVVRASPLLPPLCCPSGRKAATERETPFRTPVSLRSGSCFRASYCEFVTCGHPPFELT